MGQWLIVGDPLQPARAIVVFGGHPSVRAIEAAATYRAGWAREVWLTQDLNAAGDDPNRRILEKQGVPRSAIHVLPDPSRNTADEVWSIARHLRAVGGGRVILITSKFHTRRVRMLWNLSARAQDAIVRAAATDPYDPARWWQSSRDVRAVGREYLGMAGAWISSPLGAWWRLSINPQ